MPLTLGTNIASLNAQMGLSKATSALGSVYERLSSGLRVNKASDDAADVALASSLYADTKVFAQSVRNVNDGLSLLAIADSALQNLGSILERLSELSTQAANGSYSTAQRSALDAEAQALSAEYLRILGSTSFNGIDLLATRRAYTIQAGYGSSGNITFSLGLAGTTTTNGGDVDYADALTQTVVTGTGAQAHGVDAGDLNGDGMNDFIVGSWTTTTGYGSVFLGNGNGTFKAAISVASATKPAWVGAQDVNNDGILDFISVDNVGAYATVALGNGNGTFLAQSSYQTGRVTTNGELKFADFDGNGFVDIITNDAGDFTASVILNNGDGTFTARTIYNGDTVSPFGLATGDINGDGAIDFFGRSTSGSIGFWLGNGNGTFQARYTISPTLAPIDIEPIDFNNDGKLDLVINNASPQSITFMMGNGDGSFSTTQTITGVSSLKELISSDINQDGFKDIAFSGGAVFYSYLGNGNGTFRAASSTSLPGTPSEIVFSDFTGDGVDDIVSSVGSSITVALANVTAITTSSEPSTLSVNLLTQSAALASIDSVTAKQAEISMAQGEVGAASSRMGSTLAYVSTARDNFSAAYSMIVDADTAADIAELVRLKILQQSSTAILAQANQEPSLVLELLNGASE